MSSQLYVALALVFVSVAALTAIVAYVVLAWVSPERRRLRDLASPGTSAGPAGPEPELPWAAQERWRELRHQAERLAERVCAEGFDD